MLEKEIRLAMTVGASQQISVWGSYLNCSHLVECAKCKKASVWAARTMVYPRTSTAPLPNHDLPPDIKKVHTEARAIFDASPRAAAALIRLCLEMLCHQVGAKGGTLNLMIGNLHALGVRQEVIDMLDVGRDIGNDMVHPGQIDPTNTRQEALILFDMLNLIADRLLTEEKKIRSAQSRITDDQRERNESRNSKAQLRIGKQVPDAKA